MEWDHFYNKQLVHQLFSRNSQVLQSVLEELIQVAPWLMMSSIQELHSNGLSCLCYSVCLSQLHAIKNRRKFIWFT